MNSAPARYQSFQRNGGWRHPAHFAANPMRLAQVGFFFAPIPQAPDRVECFACGTAVARWKQHSDPKTEHLRYAPNCPFLSGNYEKFRFEAARLQSFVGKWTLAADYLAQPWRLAKSGFFHAPKPGGPDRCECFCCGIALVRWEKGDDPWREHQKHSPTCAFVRGLPTDNILLPGMVEVPAPAKKTEMEELMEEIERLDIPYDEVLPSYFVCPITQDIIRNPIVLEDGHSYEKAAIFQWLTSHNTSPLTNKPLTTKLLFPNHNLKQQLVEFAQKLIDNDKQQREHPPTTSFASSSSSSSSSSSVSFPQDVVASAPPQLPSAPHFEIGIDDDDAGQWFAPILQAVDRLLAAHRELTILKQQSFNQSSDQQSSSSSDQQSSSSSDHQSSSSSDHQSSDQQTSSSLLVFDPSPRGEDNASAPSLIDFDSSTTTQLAAAQARVDAAEAELRDVELTVVRRRVQSQLAAAAAAEEQRVRAASEAQLAEATDRAAAMIAEAANQAAAVAAEETARLREENAALISSVETLSRQRDQLVADIEAAKTRAQSLYPAQSSAAAASSTAAAEPTPPPPAADPPPPPLARKKSFFSFFTSSPSS